MSERELTGRTVLIIVVSAFAVVIGVNLLLAFQAVHTFPGLEVDNSYVASQEFDAARDAQEALGWTAAADYDSVAGLFVVRVTGRDGLPVKVSEIAVTIGRATSKRDDHTPAMEYFGGSYSAPVALGPGYWTVRFEARAEDGTPFRQRLQLFVRG
ncbi:FixH family protein [Rhodovulum euryhalinum]|uniref:Nitrogen fixation protein FixH n=1 Tax=Rhodovulum euryhalinum TaxID=35805 RepID=A0A4R2KHZ3_9RHOB|nr:FixH family protein [Rhodovulum euryhalinum]TCO71977.1 nitrogen fixation protein FixH [Rhodovulum euryhalinum]